MNRDFDRADAALASSIPGRILAFLGDTLESAWRTSSTGASARSIRGAVQAMPAPTLIRTVAVALMIAAALQPLLISAMPQTVAPAMPWPAFAVVAVLAAIAAWQAEAIVTAWPRSVLARWFGR